LDFSARDALHEKWRKGLWVKMGALIATGSLVSYLVNQASARIAIASVAAFALAGLVDLVAYQALKRKSWIQKTTGSNILAAAVDSVAFPTIAFGGFMPLVTLGQFAAKVFGGFVWALILSHRAARRAKVVPA
jgi:uncharacterized PurR-regulated membrane protein YhhQ (DUF165 family)